MPRSCCKVTVSPSMASVSCRTASVFMPRASSWLMTSPSSRFKCSSVTYKKLPLPQAGSSTRVVQSWWWKRLISVRASASLASRFLPSSSLASRASNRLKGSRLDEPTVAQRPSITATLACRKPASYS